MYKLYINIIKYNAIGMIIFIMISVIEYNDLVIFFSTTEETNESEEGEDDEEEEAERKHLFS